MGLVQLALVANGAVLGRNAATPPPAINHHARSPSISLPCFVATGCRLISRNVWSNAQIGSYEHGVRSTSQQVQSTEYLDTRVTLIRSFTFVPLAETSYSNVTLRLSSSPPFRLHHHSRLILPASPPAPSILAAELISVWLLKLQSHLFLLLSCIHGSASSSPPKSSL